jgi:murein DD-endopeptidase MepM/ murein hydrolase activator NlpD
LVKHGQYFTVYSNLAAVYVKAGQKVTTKQALGKVADDQDSGEAVLHFELWKDTYNQDPTYWILRK